MRIRLLAFATAREALGHDELELELPEGTKLAELASRLQHEHPRLAAIWSRLAIAVDGELAGPETALDEDSEVALLPPVSGGAPAPRARLVDEAIDLEGTAAEAGAVSCGAVVLFVGRVRNRHRERPVRRLTYDAYRPMALRALETIADELEAASSGLKIRIVHRLGEIPVGEASVVIAAGAPHREAAFRASRTALERLKREVPIWKQEHYADGETAWREDEPLDGPLERASI